MRLLVDTHVVLALNRGELKKRYPRLASLLNAHGNDLFVSVASIWEIAIKARIGKLDPGVPAGELEALAQAGGLAILPIIAAHAVADLSPEPPTRDPFDRMLLAQCAVEDMQLVTVDHPLAWRPA